MTSSKKNMEQVRSHWIEWATGLIATVMILAMIGWLLFEAATTRDRPPQLSAKVLEVAPLSSGWRVMIEVRNDGDQAAAAVDVKATLTEGDATVEEAQTTFDYVAAGSTSRGGLIFKQDPSSFGLEVVPTGFTEP